MNEHDKEPFQMQVQDTSDPFIDPVGYPRPSRALSPGLQPSGSLCSIANLELESRTASYLLPQQ